MSKYVLTFLLCGMSSLAVFAQETPPAPPAPNAKAENKDPYAVPEGSDTTALSIFLKRLAQTPPPERTPEGIRTHLQKLDEAVAEVLTRDIEEQLFVSATQVRLQVLSLLPQFGDNLAVAKRAKLIDQLKHDERPAVKEIAAQIIFQERVRNLPQASDEEKNELISELSGRIQNAGMQNPQELQQAVSMAMNAAQMLERTGDTEHAVAAYSMFAKNLKAKKIPQLDEMVEQVESTVRRLSLPGNVMEVSGTTVDGQPFSVENWRGKVVLVDFWATWCGPCIAELPNVKSLYDAYHDKGFEVVGISLDDDEQALVQFLKDREIAWTTLFPAKEDERGWENPIARHYGVSGIPTAILLDKEGKVVDLNARGERLAESLAELLGPVEEKQPAESGE